MREALSTLYGHLLWHASGHRGIPWRLRDGGVCRLDPRCRWVNNPDYESAVVDYLRARVTPGACCIDIGAHVGFYVVQMARWSRPSGTVVAFEPNPVARRLLHSNIRLNGLEGRVSVESLAVSDATGEKAFIEHSTANGLSRLAFPGYAGDGGVVRVGTVSLDDYCAAHSVHPDCVLIDVEGAEREVLAGAAEVLRHTRALVVVEMHVPLWSSPETGREIESIARSAGRRIAGVTAQRDPLAEYGTVALVPF